MPITFKEADSIPDIMSSDRFTVFFPDIPGSNIKNLSIKTVSVTLPPFEVGQIIVKAYGWVRNFAGRRINQNSFSISSYESVDAGTLSALALWQKDCADFTKAGGLMSKDYAKDIEIEVYDTTGSTALHFKCINSWPLRISLPQLDDDQSVPMRLDCDMSVDAVDFLAIENKTSGKVFTTSNKSIPKSLGDVPRSSIEKLPDSVTSFLSQLNPSSINSVDAFSRIARTNIPQLR